jgi:hypothetical protein
MQINHFLPFFFCSVNLIFNKLFCNSSLLNRSPLHHIVLSFCSSSACSVILLCFCSAFISLYFIFSHSCYASAHTTLFLTVYSFSFRTTNQIQSRSYSFIHSTLTIPLPLPIGNTRTSVLATETLTDLSSSVHFS